MADNDLDYMNADVRLFLADSTQDSDTATPKLQFGRVSKTREKFRGGSERTRGKGRSWLGKREEKGFNQKQQEDELRAVGLETAIPTSNIGFKLLQQMGYRPGQAIGKEGHGRTEPLGIDLKRNRGGLGRDAELREESQRKAARSQQAAKIRNVSQQQLAAEFQERTRGKWEGKRLRRDIERCRTALAKFDGREDDLVAAVDADSHEEKVHRGSKSQPGREGAESEDTDDQEFTVEVLHELREHLRSAHHYCIYCGIKYESRAALEAECPGEEDDMH